MLIIISVHLLSLSGAYLIPAGHEDGVDFESGAAASKATVSHAKNTGSQKRRKLSSKTESAFKTTRSAGMYYVCMCVYRRIQKSFMKDNFFLLVYFCFSFFKFFLNNRLLCRVARGLFNG